MRLGSSGHASDDKDAGEGPLVSREDGLELIPKGKPRR
jgi:hypothetical protein